MSSSGNFEKIQSNLDDISVASSENLEISENSRLVEIGELYPLCLNRTAAIASGYYSEESIQISSLLYRENIIPFYSEDVCSKDAIIGTLSDYLIEEKRYNFTWAQRLKTCIGVAKGISYLHSGVGDHGRIILGCIRSSCILLNENLEAKICGLDASVLVRENQQRIEIYRPPTFPRGDSTDPVYLESNILNIESDIYAYGILMFEMLTGMEPDGPRLHPGGWSTKDYTLKKMINLVRGFCDDGPEQLIDPYIIDNVDRRSFHMFIEIAYNCISLNIKDRPTMDVIVKMMEDALDIHNQQAVSAISKRRNPADSLKIFQISLEEIHKATKNSATKPISEMEVLLWSTEDISLIAGKNEQLP